MASTIAEFDHLKIPLEKILEATNNFDDKNVIGESSFGKVYKGQLLHYGELIKISARRLDRKEGQGDVEFWTEISALSVLRHDNIVSMIGLCDETDEKIIIYHHDVKGSLSMYLSDPNFTWYDRLRACVGIAKAIDFIHHDEGRAFSFVHRNINSSTILLDDKWQPKLSGFEFSVKHSLSRKNKVIPAEVIGTKGYIDPTYVKTGTVSHKSDVYSFGVVLFDILCGKNAAYYNPYKQGKKKFRPPLPKFQNERKALRDSWEEVGQSRFTNLAYSCLDKEREQRPDIYEVILELTRMESIIQPYTGFSITRVCLPLVRWIYKAPGRLMHLAYGLCNSIIEFIVAWMYLMLEFGEAICKPLRKEVEPLKQNIMASRITEFDHLKIPLENILEATNNFDDKNVIGEGDFGKVYKGKLWHSRKFINISARRLDRNHGQGDVEFLTEVFALSVLRHDNIVSMIGFCDEMDEKIIINRHDVKGSLSMYLSDPTFTWYDRLRACVGIAKAIEYIHHVEGRAFSFVHRNINSSTILLDHKWQPKLSGFEFSIKHSLDRKNKAICTEVIGAKGYIDPTYVDTGTVSHKSDVYSFGIILFDILCGRNLYIMNERGKENFRPPLPKFYNESEKLRESWEDDGQRRFTKLARSCLNKEREQRPAINEVIHTLTVMESIAQGFSVTRICLPLVRWIYKGPDRLMHFAYELCNSIIEFIVAWMYLMLELGEAICKPLRKEVEPLKQNIMASRITEFDHLKIPLEKILEATNNFDDKNVIGEGDFGKVYKGKLWHSRKFINISARRLDRNHGQGDVEFWTEISALTVLRHDNIVAMIGFCDEMDEKIIINRHDVKGSLSMYLSDPTFTWYDRLRACVGIAKAIEYIHHVEGRAFSFVHRNINSSTILLDHKWQPKLSGFEFSIKHSLDRKNKAIRTEVIGTKGYIDPMYVDTGTVSYKSDVYSFGIILFDILCGRNLYIMNERGKENFQPPLPKFYNESEKIRESWEDNGQLRFTKLARSCLNKEREQRPAINEVIHTLTVMESIAQGFPVTRVCLALVRWIYKAPGRLMHFASEGCHPIMVIILFTHLLLEYGEKVRQGLRKEVYKEVESFKNPAVTWRYLGYVWGFLAEMASILIVFFKVMAMALTDFKKGLFEKKDTSKEEFNSLKDSPGKWSCLANVCLAFLVKVVILLIILPIQMAMVLTRCYTKEIFDISDKNIKHLRINLKDIQLATRDFSLANPVQLECFDRDYISSVKGMKETELPKKLYTVRINRIRWAKASYSDVEIASRCKHRNIQPILGFCDEDSDKMILVYKNESYKLLRGCLSTLTWEQRLKICIDVAQGLHYLHYEMEDQKMVIHNYIALKNIVLDDNWVATIANFQRSVFLPPNQDVAAFDNEVFYKKYCYIDPEYSRSKKLRRESDVYSFGVVMSEILFGKSMNNMPVYEQDFMRHPDNFAKPWARDVGILKEAICPALKETYSENNFILHKGPDEDSLNVFIQIMCECLAPTHTQRPTMKVVIAKLKRALSLQENYKDTFRILYADIELATENFNRHNYVGGGGFGEVYKGEIARGNGHQAIVAKRLDTRFGQGEEQYYNELEILRRYKHENVIGLVGYSNETSERIIVYEHASRGSLDRYLNDARLTWKKRLNICIDVASGLAFLHGDAETGQDVVIHRDIKTPNILLFDDWKAKVGDFGLSLITTVYEDKNYIIDHACGTRGYLDPVYAKTGFLTIESDIYSFGVVLFEILCGRSTYPVNKHERPFLDSVKHNYEEGKQDEMVFEAIKKETVPKSLTTFQMIAYRCLHDDRGKRPTAKEVLAQLKMALEYQEENNIQELDVMDLSGNLEDINNP